ncbi:MAG: dolichyl-phosphate beta-glucosyltransferase [Planctomycetia bacterium]
MAVSNADARPTISVVVPALNEERRLRVTLIDAFAFFRGQFAHNWELIVVDDGSHDRTRTVVQEISCECPELRLLSHETNHGKGAAVRTGVLASRGDLVLFADADNATPFSEVDKLLWALQQGADIACGSRFGREAGQVRRTWLRRVVANVFSTFARWTVRPGVSDTQCGFKLFSGDVARALFRESCESGYLFDLEILALASQSGLKVAEVPVRWREVPGSKVRILQDSWRMFCGLFRVRRQIRRRQCVPSASTASLDNEGRISQCPLGLSLPVTADPLPRPTGGAGSVSAGATQ